MLDKQSEVLIKALKLYTEKWMEELSADEELQSVHEFSFMLEALEDVDNSPLNPTALLDAEKDKDLRMYITCGLQDNLLVTNKLFKEKADELSIKAHYVFEDGGTYLGVLEQAYRDIHRFYA